MESRIVRRDASSEFYLTKDLRKLKKYQELFAKLAECPKDEPEYKRSLITKINTMNLKDNVL